MPKPLHILIAPLDWGLGHATRCIPLIRYLLEKQCHVTLAGQGATEILLKSNFPQLRMLPLAGYGIEYSRSGIFLPMKILTQIPRILKSISQERAWLQKAQDDNQFDLVISDNRYGLKIKGVPSIILTHQLQIRTGAGFLFDRILRIFHYKILESFDACWVVDKKLDGNIGGYLSHPDRLPRNARYIGILSQLSSNLSGDKTLNGKILVLLSGPEPQRTLLENLILRQIGCRSKYTYWVVGGIPGRSTPERVPSGTVYFTHRNADELAELLASCELVICRSGYSTLMDLAFLGKKALLIPTPGQSEQLYLARYLSKNKLFYSQKQSSLDLESDVTEALTYPGFSRDMSDPPMQEMKSAIDEIIRDLGCHTDTQT